MVDLINQEYKFMGGMININLWTYTVEICT